MITLTDIQQAGDRISAYIQQTPLVQNYELSTRLGAQVYLKLEMFQRTGAFKIRGALNKMLTLNEEERRRGVVAVSGGNHAQAVACAAHTLGVEATLLMPVTTPRNYLQATGSYGACVVLTRTMREAFEEARAYEREGLVYIHPFDDPLVMAGQGTLGLEVLEDVPALTDVVVSIGGGGLMAGVAIGIKSLKPEVRVWGVETEGADSMSRALEAGRVVELPEITSVAHTLGAPAVSETTLSLARKYLEGVTVVSDAEAIQGLLFLLEHAKVLTEPAASCTLAAAERLHGQFSLTHHVALILCGGNVSLDDVEHLKGRLSELSSKPLQTSGANDKLGFQGHSPSLRRRSS